MRAFVSYIFLFDLLKLRHYPTGWESAADPIGVEACSFYQSITNLFATDGRRPVYLTVLPIFAMGSLGVALARNVQQLLLFRVVQAFGGGGGMSIGAGVISDIYRLEQRGTAMGVFFAVSETIWTCARSHV